MQAQYPPALWLPHSKFGYPQGTRGRNGQTLKYVVVHGTVLPGTAEKLPATSRPAPSTRVRISSSGAMAW